MLESVARVSLKSEQDVQREPSGGVTNTISRQFSDARPRADSPSFPWFQLPLAPWALAHANAACRDHAVLPTIRKKIWKPP